MKFLDYISISSTSNILFEKDHRSKMVKFGIPEGVAEYLHNFDDKYSIWFANQIKDMEGYKRALDKVNWINNNLREDMVGIMDWVANIPQTRLSDYNWEDAVRMQREYHERFKRSSREIHETNKIIKEYDDGFYWVDLESPFCREEGELVDHCGRTHMAETIWSLRSYSKAEDKLFGWVSMAVSPSEGKWTQAKAAKNSVPPEKFHKYIADILVSNEIFKYQKEYKADFNDQHLYEYVDSHREEFDNPDEILEKIEGNRVAYDDFVKLIPSDMEYYRCHLDEDYYYDEDGSTISAHLSFSASIEPSELDLDDKSEEELETIFKDGFEIDFGKIFNYYLETHYNDDAIRVSITDGIIEIDVYFNTEDNQYYQMDEVGLISCENFMDDLYRNDKNFDKEEFIEAIKDWLKKEEHIESSYMYFLNKIKTISESKDLKNADIIIDPDYDNFAVIFTFPIYNVPIDIPYNDTDDGSSLAHSNSSLLYIKRIFDDFTLFKNAGRGVPETIKMLLGERDPTAYIFHFINKLFKGLDFATIKIEVSELGGVNRSLNISFSYEFDDVKDNQRYSSDFFDREIKRLFGIDSYIPRLKNGFNKMLLKLVLPEFKDNIIKLSMDDIEYELIKTERDGDPRYDTGDIIIKSDYLKNDVSEYISWYGNPKFAELMDDPELLKNTVEKILESMPLFKKDYKPDLSKVDDYILPRDDYTPKKFNEMFLKAFND